MNTETNTSTDTRWEYTTAASSIVDQSLLGLDTLGHRGWEVVGIVPHPTDPNVVRCLLKRPVRDDRLEDPEPWLTRQPESQHHAPSPDEPEYNSRSWALWRKKYERDMEK